MDTQQLIDSAEAFELSWSLANGQQEARALLGWYNQSAPLAALQSVALNWGMPTAMVNQWVMDAESAEAVALGLNADLTSLRLYTQSGLSGEDTSLSEVGYRAYKCMPDGSVRVDDYLCAGDLRDDANLAFAKATSQQPQWLDHVVEQAPADLPLRFVRIDNSGRQSWLATVYLAQLDAGAIAGQEFSGRPLLHLAGGMDAVKGAFDSIYVASSATEISSFLQYAKS